MKPSTLRGASTATKLLYSSFLMLTGIGYIAALILLYMTHAGLDGRPGIDMTDIVQSYYGNRSGTRLEAAIRGPMKAHIGPIERDIISDWLLSGTSRKGYEAEVKPILQKDCMTCHSAKMSAVLKNPNLSTYDALRQVTKVDKGASLLSLVKLSHIHLFGISLILFAIGVVFVKAELVPWLQYSLIVLPFAAILADVLAWFLTKIYPLYAYVVVVGGALMGLAMGAQILIALYQMWLMRPAPAP